MEYACGCLINSFQFFIFVAVFTGVLASVFSGCLPQSSLYFVNECYVLKNGAVHHIFDINTYPFVAVFIVLLCCSPQDPTLA